MRQSLAASLLLALGAAASGCASPIQSMMLTDDTALVSAIGYKPEDQGKVIEDSLKEAAKLTAAKGFRYFVILDAADASRPGRQIVVQSAIRQTFPETFPPAGGSIGYTRPGLDMTIRMYRDGEIDPKTEGLWNSAELLARP
jgi:hypothetical protein